MLQENNKIVYFASTNFRNERTTFGIKKEDRGKHMYIIGKTGMGKTTLSENMAIQDIQNGEGLGVVDPHGSFAEKMLDFIPKERIKDVIYFNPADNEWPIAFNIMEDVGKEQRYLVANGLMGVFKKMWPDVWSARMEYILNNAILALLEYPDSTLLGVNRMLADKDYRKEVVSNVTDPVVKAFWQQEFAKYTERFAAEATPAIQNKVGQFTANPLIRNIIGQPKSSFDFRKAMDEKKIVLMGLSKGKIGELNSQLIGSMLITKIYLAAMGRAAEPVADWPNFYLYVDEFQNFATESFKDILSEARKYKLALILAHQYIEQLGEGGVKEAIFGNVGTHVVFRVGAYDAEVLEKEFAPEFTAEEIVNLGFANIYIKLMIDGIASRPFSAATLPPMERPKESNKKAIIEFSRKNYCSTKKEVEKKISSWHEPLERPPVSQEGKQADKEEEVVPQKLFESSCSVCSKKILVPFEPDRKRPIFCPKHRSYLAEKPQSQAPRRQQQTPQESTISLRKLDERTTDFRKDFRAKKEKPSPDFKGLRELLSDVAEEDDNKDTKEEKSESNEKTLKPGESVKF
jgi:CxxC-x17-CxxC domain-containing protein